MRYVNRRSISAGLGVLAAVAFIAGCNSGNNDTTAENAQATAGIRQILHNQPVPVFPRSDMRASLTTVEAVQALGGPTTSFMMPMGSGGTGVDPIDACASEGFPIPFGTELSNPTQISNIDTATNKDLGGTGNVIDQMDPNGVYAGGNSSGTYVMCVTASGKASPRYWEGPVETVPGSANWNTTTHSVVTFGPQNLPICTLEGSGKGAHYNCTLPPGAKQNRHVPTIHS